MNDKNEGAKEKAAAAAAMSGFATCNPVGIAIGLGAAVVILGVGCLIERTHSNYAHVGEINRYRFDFNVMDTEIARVRKLIDEINSQNEVQIETINHYRQICENLRVQYGHAKDEYKKLFNVVEELEQVLNDAANGNRDHACVVM